MVVAVGTIRVHAVSIKVHLTSRRVGASRRTYPYLIHNCRIRCDTDTIRIVLKAKRKTRKNGSELGIAILEIHVYLMVDELLLVIVHITLRVRTV